MNRVANYDTLDYDYSTYWKAREYEHRAEEIVLEKLLKESKGEWFLDIGGSFGRLLPTYVGKYKNCVIVDYSLKTLIKNREQLQRIFPNVELIAANAYHLPFKEESFNASLMVRVLHHLENPKQYISEVYRVLAPGSIHIQEFANKLHIKAVLRGILKFDFQIFNKEPYQQPDRNNNEGARENANVPFLNYHTSWLKESFMKEGFKLERKYGCSYLRIDALKRILNTNILIFFEKIFQNILSWTNLSPSIFLKFSKNSKGSNSVKRNLSDILVCPQCKSDLKIHTNTAKCKECKKEYRKESNIWDFRV